MKKILLILCIVITGCNTNTEKDLEQSQMEAWIRANTIELSDSYSTTFDNGYGAKHRASMNNIKLTEIGQIEIVDDYTRSIYATLAYKEMYNNGNYNKDNAKTNTCVFVFKKSTDGKWYLSAIHGDNNRPFYTWMKEIKDRNKKKPIE